MSHIQAPNSGKSDSHYDSDADLEQATEATDAQNESEVQETQLAVSETPIGTQISQVQSEYPQTGTLTGGGAAPQSSTPTHSGTARLSTGGPHRVAPTGDATSPGRLRASSSPLPLNTHGSCLRARSQFDNTPPRSAFQVTTPLDITSSTSSTGSALTSTLRDKPFNDRMAALAAKMKMHEDEEEHLRKEHATLREKIDVDFWKNNDLLKEFVPMWEEFDKIAGALPKKKMHEDDEEYLRKEHATLREKIDIDFWKNDEFLKEYVPMWEEFDKIVGALPKK